MTMGRPRRRLPEPAIHQGTRPLPGTPYERTAYSWHGRTLTFVTDPADTDAYTDHVRSRFDVEPVTQFACEWLRGGGSCIDVGANIGTVSLPIAALGSRVLAIEALPKNFVLLSLAANQSGTDLLPIHAAAGDAIGTTRLSGVSAWAAVVESGGVEVPLLSLDAISDMTGFRRPDLVKIDVEGSERRVLRGMSRMIEEHRPLIIIESNSWTSRANGYSYHELLSDLESHGYGLYLVTGSTLTRRSSADMQEICVADYIAAPAPLDDRDSAFEIGPLSTARRLELLARDIDVAPEHRWHIASVIHEYAEQLGNARAIERIRGRLLAYGEPLVRDALEGGAGRAEAPKGDRPYTPAATTRRPAGARIEAASNGDVAVGMRELRRENSLLRSRLAETESQLRGLSDLAWMPSSWSWRLTAPLRMARQAIRPASLSPGRQRAGTVRLLPPAPRDPTGPAILWIDVGDLLAWDIAHVTGIQRVMTSVLAEVLTDSMPVVIRYCRFDRPTGFSEVSRDELSAKLDGLAGRSAASRAPGGRDTTKPGNARCGFRRGDVLVNFGSSWRNAAYIEGVTRVKASAGIKYVAVLYDLIPYVLGEGFFPPRKGPDEFEHFLRGTCKAADLILAISEHTRADLLAYAAGQGVAAPPVEVVRLGQAPPPTPQPLGLIGPDARAVTTVPYVLFVSTLERRKNHRLAYEAWSELVERHGERVPDLVFIGETGWGVDALLEEFRRSRYLNGRLRQLTGVSDSELSYLYRNCCFTIFPSVYEGWGLPIAESMSFGKVCIASNAASIPEVAGDLAEYHDPNDLAGFIRLLERAILDDDWRQARERAIRDRYRIHPWSATAGQLVRAAQGLMAGGLPEAGEGAQA